MSDATTGSEQHTTSATTTLHDSNNTSPGPGPGTVQNPAQDSVSQSPSLSAIQQDIDNKLPKSPSQSVMTRSGSSSSSSLEDEQTPAARGDSQRSEQKNLEAGRDKEGIIIVDWEGPDDPENPRK